MVIHNYIRKKFSVDGVFQTAENEEYFPSVDPDVSTSSRANNINIENIKEQSSMYWMGFHDMIANDISNA
ncbi:hypothetical protein P3S68_004471 [Capsicum galapagoense]